MKKSNRLKIKNELFNLCLSITEYTQKFIETLKKIGIDISPAIPSAFLTENILFDCAYSEKRKQVMLIISKNFSIVKDDLFDAIDIKGYWKNTVAFIKIDNGITFSYHSGSLKGRKPFELGKNSKAIITNTDLIFFNGNIYHIDFGLFIPLEYFYYLQRSYFTFINDIFILNWSFYKLHNNITYEIFKLKLNNLKVKMEELFFNELIEEHIIDKF